MAKKAAAADGAPNKSQAIRDALSAYPSHSPKEIAANLKKAGVEVSAAYVSVVKSSLKKGGAKKSVKVRKPTAAAGGLDTLSATVDFIRRVGGLEAARQALATVEQIKSL